MGKASSLSHALAVVRLYVQLFSDRSYDFDGELFQNIAYWYFYRFYIKTTLVSRNKTILYREVSEADIDLIKI